MTDAPTPLSTTGLRRREQILSLAMAESQKRRRRRIAIKTAALCVMMGVLLARPLWIRHRPEMPVVVKPQAPITPQEPRIVIARIETDPHIIERLAIPSQPPHVILIDDRELLKELAEAHEPAGLAYVNGKAVLLFR